MKRTITFIVAGLLVLAVLLFLAMHAWIEHSVKENIAIAKSHYSGTAEEALIAFLQDSTNTPDDRTHIAIWTLGQIRSEKSLPYLYDLYVDDPEGMTCKGKHDSVLCQYGIHKAIVSIESELPGSKKKIWLGAWQRHYD